MLQHHRPQNPTALFRRLFGGVLLIARTTWKARTSQGPLSRGPLSLRRAAALTLGFFPSQRRAHLRSRTCNLHPSQSQSLEVFGSCFERHPLGCAFACRQNIRPCQTEPYTQDSTGPRPPAPSFGTVVCISLHAVADNGPVISHSGIPGTITWYPSLVSDPPGVTAAFTPRGLRPSPAQMTPRDLSQAPRGL